MIKVRPSYAPGEYPWTREDISQMRDATELALDEAGTHTKLAKWCGTTMANVGAWRRKGYIPSQYVIAVAEVTGVKPAALRPDLYRKPKKRKREYRQ